MPLVVGPYRKEKSSSKGKGGGQSTFIYVSHSKLRVVHRKSCELVIYK